MPSEAPDASDGIGCGSVFPGCRPVSEHRIRRLIPLYGGGHKGLLIV
ncbi:hypothetical protein [Neisseria lactamica]|nr:hypothetical protein [Neisseria lactamica]